MKRILTLLFVLLIGTMFAQTYKVAQKVLIKYNDDWYPGKILEVRTEGYYISYDAYDESWNEVVGTDRLKNADGTVPQATTAKTPVTPAPAKNVNTGTPASGDVATSKANDYCKCMENANQTKKLADKEKCLDLKDTHLASFEAGSQQYMDYKQKITECKNNGSNNATNAPKTFEAKVKEVCDCFTEAKKDKSKRMSCFKLQGQYGGDYDGDDTIKFLTETNKCDN